MMTAALAISGRIVGIQAPTLVIAEIGVNHDGSVERALELVDTAARTGADCVKLQIFQAAMLMHGSATFAAYQQDQCADADPAAMLRRYELSRADLSRVVDAIRERNMIPLATPFSLTDLPVIAELDLPAIKIASPDLVNRPLLLDAARLHKPMLLSTGAATMTEVETTVGWLRKWGVPFALLHCISSYPVPDGDANLCWITELAARFGVPVGYSDHSTDVLSGALAVAAGACAVEKHLTYDRAAVGPDHAASADPEQFEQYVKHIRRAEVLRGRPGKRVLDTEQDVRVVSRQSLVLRRELLSGDTVRSDDLAVQRPGTGIPAAMSERVVGRKIIRTLAAGTLLQWDMLSDVV